MFYLLCFIFAAVKENDIIKSECAKIMVIKKGFQILLVCLFMVSCKQQAVKQDDLSKLTWQQVEAKGKGAQLTMMMYQGDKKVNRYMNEYLVPALQQQYGITLTLVPGQGKDIVNNLMGEKEAGKAKSDIDLCWINGETFYQLRQIDALFGPYTDQLPNSKYVDFDNPVIRYDFQQEIKGYETPWGESFYYMIYDSAKTANPPVSMQQWQAWWQQHPGRFTLATDFNGMTLLKTWLIELAGGSKELDGKFDDQKYQKLSAQLWQFINTNKKYFWKKGETFPAGNTSISQMFGSGELDFTPSFNDADIDNKVAEGVFPAASKAYILQPGSIHNTHYVGITANSGNKEAAMLVCNFLISPAAQIRKNDITEWGSRTVLSYDKLEKNWQQKFDSLPKRKYGITTEQLKSNSIKEPEPEYMLRVFDDFRKKVIEAS